MLRAAFCALSVLLSGVAAAAVNQHPWSEVFAEGLACRQRGDLQCAVARLTSSRDLAADQAQKTQSAAELGIALLQARRYDAAESSLNQAHAASRPGAERARLAIHLGLLAQARHRPAEARDFFALAVREAGAGNETGLAARLNLLRLAGAANPLDLEALSRDLLRLEGPAESGHLHFGLGAQAMRQDLPALAYRHLDTARRLAESGSDLRLQAEALAALAKLYATQTRTAEALQLARQGLERARRLPAGSGADLLIALEELQGRLLRQQGLEPAALAAYQRAVEQIEAVRQDIPIETEDGESSFKQVLEPVYLGYLDLLLRQAGRASGATATADLRRVIDTAELIRQAEMQDYLGERCAVETAQGGSHGGRLPEATAVLYPLIFADRLELLLETSSGIVRRSVPVSGERLRASIAAFDDALRSALPGYLPQAQQLYRWLLAPFAAELAAGQTRQLVIVPDGALRLVPLAALHDGERFVVERWALALSTGLSMTHLGAPQSSRAVSLVAGVATPGPVIEKMAQSALIERWSEPTTLAVRQTPGGLQTRSLTLAAAGLRSADPVRYRQAVEQMRQNLSLPGVRGEIEALNGILSGASLLDDRFTVGQFGREIDRGDYRIVHIASHGVFGGTADSSFIIAYDDVLDMNHLESLLKNEKFQDQPIDLLSLSACQTAEGNERAPLGISGVAIKARARSVLGTLWPVEDNAARQLMKTFYARLVGTGNDKSSAKGEALRQGQLELLRTPQTAHPFFWAPFVLIGNWQ